MILSWYRAFKTSRLLFSKVLGPVYAELKKDAEELEQKGKEQNKNTSKKHVIHQESKRSHQRKTNP